MFWFQLNPIRKQNKLNPIILMHCDITIQLYVFPRLSTTKTDVLVFNCQLKTSNLNPTETCLNSIVKNKELSWESNRSIIQMMNWLHWCTFRSTYSCTEWLSHLIWVYSCQKLQYHNSESENLTFWKYFDTKSIKMSILTNFYDFYSLSWFSVG